MELAIWGERRELNPDTLDHNRRDYHSLTFPAPTRRLELRLVDRQSTVLTFTLCRLVDGLPSNPSLRNPPPCMGDRSPFKWYPLRESNPDLMIRSHPPCPLGQEGYVLQAPELGCDPSQSGLESDCRPANTGLCSTSPGIRTQTVPGLSRIPLPIGIERLVRSARIRTWTSCLSQPSVN